MEIERPKVMCNILNIGTIHAGLESKSIQWMSEYRDKYNFELFLPSARPIPNNRNSIVKKFLEGDWDILFMMDDDNIPLVNPFTLLDNDKDVCGGCYPGRSDRGFNFHVFMLDKKQYPEKIFFNFVPPEKREGLQKVDAVATGCIAIKRHVLEKMIEKKLAPFEDMFDEEGILITNDDMAFCLKCMDLGIDVYADWDVMCDHIKPTSLLQVIRFILEAARTGKAVMSTPDGIGGHV